MATIVRSVIPFRFRLIDFSQRLDVEWNEMLRSLPASFCFMRKVFTYEDHNLSDLRRSAEDLNTSMYRMAPVHPWLRINLRPQRHILWGLFVALKNAVNCMVLLSASIVCHAASKSFHKCFTRSAAYVSILHAINVVVLCHSAKNTLWAVQDGVSATSRLFFDPYRGLWVNQDLYSNKELQQLKTHIHSLGNLYFQIRQLNSGEKLSNLIGIKHYETLELSRMASQTEIDEAFIHMRKMYLAHGEGAKVNEINAVYAVLGNPEKRALYDIGGEGAVYTRGSNPLFLGFCNPYSSVHRVDLSEYIGGPLITTWFIGDPYFGHLQLRNLDRIQVSAAEFEMLMFIRIGNVCDSLYHRVLKHAFEMDLEEFSKRATTFVQRYVITSPLGIYIATMLGDIYLACAHDIARSPGYFSEAKKVSCQKMLNFFERMYKQFNAYRTNDQHMMGYNTISAQLDALEVDIWYVSRLAISRLLAQISDSNTHKRIGAALEKFALVMQKYGKRWDDSGKMSVQELHQEMNSQAARWRSVDLGGISFV